jgi:hypothetical protein
MTCCPETYFATDVTDTIGASALYPPRGSPFNRSSAGQSRDTSNRTNGHFGAMTSTNVGYLPRTAPLRWRAQIRLIEAVSEA